MSELPGPAPVKSTGGSYKGLRELPGPAPVKSTGGSYKGRDLRQEAAKPGGQSDAEQRPLLYQAHSRRYSLRGVY